MYYYMIGQIVTVGEETHIRNSSIRQYAYAPAMTSVITDYIVATHATTANPFIIGKLNIDDAQKKLLTRTLTGTITFDRLKTYRSIFPEGFVIDSNYKNEEDITAALGGNLRITGSKVLWKVGF